MKPLIHHALSHHSVGTAEEANNNKDTFSKWSTNGIETILKSQNTNCNTLKWFDCNQWQYHCKTKANQNEQQIAKEQKSN